MEGSRKRNPNLPIIRIVFIVVSFLLALLDMTLLSKSWNIVTRQSVSTSTFVAFALATAANFIALTWGWGNGRRSERKIINKRSFGEAAAWIIIGIVYLVVRVIEIFVSFGSEDFNIIGKIAEISVLAVSYVGTGFLITTSAREIFDADSVAYRRAKKEFEQAHDEIAENDAALRLAIGILEQYDLNYDALERQKNKISSAIYKAERGTMESIAGIEEVKHDINPVYVNEIINEVIGKK